MEWIKVSERNYKLEGIARVWGSGSNWYYEFRVEHSWPHRSYCSAEEAKEAALKCAREICESLAPLVAAEKVEVAKCENRAMCS